MESKLTTHVMQARQRCAVYSASGHYGNFLYYLLFQLNLTMAQKIPFSHFIVFFFLKQYYWQR